MSNELIERIHAWEFLAHRNEAEDIGQLLADIKQALELPKQEPVLWVNKYQLEIKGRVAITAARKEHQDYGKIYDTPLYASQPKVEYVPISDWDKIKIAETKNGIRLELINYIEEEVVRRMKEQGLV